MYLLTQALMRFLELVILQKIAHFKFQALLHYAEAFAIAKFKKSKFSMHSEYWFAQFNAHRSLCSCT